MAETAELQKTEDGIVMVRCLGIACATGFSLNPDGYDPSFVTFAPDKASPLAQHYADWLMAQDPTKFIIEKSEKARQQDQSNDDASKQKPGKKAGAKKQ